MHLVFGSKVPIQSRAAVENLFFFNPQQSRVRNEILKALETFGEPRLEEKEGNIYLRVGKNDAQTLFAFDRAREDCDPIGVVVFLRTTHTEIAIVHLAVHPDHVLSGHREKLGVGLALVEQVEEIASRIVGVEKLVLSYRQGVSLSLRRPAQFPQHLRSA